LVQSGQLCEAELVLVREAEKDKSHLRVRDALAAINVALALQAIAASNFALADRELLSASVTVQNMKGIVVMPDTSFTPGDTALVAARERQLNAAEEQLRRTAELECRTALATAKQRETAARRRFAPNDRQEVVAGLKSVRRCVEVGQWISADVRGDANSQLDRLLALVTKRERDKLLAAAGF